MSSWNFTLLYLVGLIAATYGCRQLLGPSGTIRDSGNFGVSPCWTFVVPEGTYIRLNTTRFDSPYSDCSRIYIAIEEFGTTYNICPGQSNRQPIVAFGDITIRVKNYNGRSYDLILHYSLESLTCAQKESFACDAGNCIAKSQVCDGTRDCDNGSDERGCESGVFAVEGVNEARLKALQWLNGTGSYFTGWKENTHRAITALYLAADRKFSNVTLLELLRLKQLESQTLVALLRNDTEPLTANQLSMFVNALLVTCQDPRHFHGFDLVGMLKDQVESSPLASHPVSYLALCNANESLPENATDDLVRVLNSDADYPFLLDVQAASVMALSCLNIHNEEVSNTSDTKSSYDEAVKKLESLQLQDGSFGNVYTTAIVTQALLSADRESSKAWKLKNAVKYLMDRLNSSSVDFLSTYLALPVLNGKSLSDIKYTNCTGNLWYKAEGDSLQNIKNRLGPRIRVQYSLYIGEDKDVVHTIVLRVPEKITAFEVMQLAESQDAKYRFHWKQMGSKIYVYDIANVTNDFEDGHFWMMYVGKSADSVLHSVESPEKVVIEDGQYLVMWYKRAMLH